MRMREVGKKIGALALGLTMVCASLVIAPAIDVAAESISSGYYLMVGTDGTLTPTNSWDEFVAGTGAIIGLQGGTTEEPSVYDAITVSGSTVTIKNLSAVNGEGLKIYREGVTLVFEGTNELVHIVSDYDYTVQAKDASSTLKVRLYMLGRSYNTTSGSIAMTVGENTSMTFESGLAWTYVQRYNSNSQEWGPGPDSSDITQEDIAVTTYPAGTTITATVSIPSDTSQTGTSATKDFQNALFQYAGSSSGGSGSSGSSGSSSGGGAAIMGTLTPVTVTSTPTYVADSSATADMSDNSTINSATVKTSENGTAKITNVESNAKTVKISSKVKVDGVSYTVKTIGEGALDGCANATTVTLPKTVTKIEENALSGAENLKVVKLDVKKSIKVEKGAFGDTDTSKMTIKVSKDMSKKEFNKFKKVLKSAGFEGKVKRTL